MDFTFSDFRKKVEFTLGKKMIKEDRKMTGQTNALTKDARHLHFTSGQKRRKAFAFRVRIKNHAMQDHDRTKKTQGICISRHDKKRRKAFAFRVRNRNLCLGLYEHPLKKYHLRNKNPCLGLYEHPLKKYHRRP